MSTAKRVALGALALLLLASTALIFAPLQIVSDGVSAPTIPGTSRAIITITDPHGAAGAAGLRSGDVVDLNGLSIRDRLELFVPIASETFRLPVQRGGHRLRSRFTMRHHPARRRLG